MPIKINLTKPQSEFFVSPHKFTAFVGGFGSGKSHTLFCKMLVDKLEYPKLDIGYFAPSYQLIRDIAHVRLLNMLDETNIPYKLNKADNVLDLFKYGRILFRSMDIPDRIVGFEIGSAYIDEIDTMTYADAENAWNKIIARCRQINKKEYPGFLNRIYAATTPEGYNFVYHRWVKEKKPGYHMIQAPTRSNPHLADDYVQSLMDSYPANLIKAYLEGEFVNLNSKQVYPNFDRTTNSTTRTHSNVDTLHIGVDFNVLNTNAIVHLLDKESRQAFAVEELTQMVDTPDFISTVKEKYPNNLIYIYPDASGTSKKSVDASKSDIKLIRDAGFFVRAKSKNPLIKDRLQAMNGMFRTGDDQIHYWVNPDTCPQYTAALEQHTYDKNGKPVKDPNNSIDDINDAAGYCIYYNFPINRKQFKEARVISF